MSCFMKVKGIGLHNTPTPSLITGPIELWATLLTRRRSIVRSLRTFRYIIIIIIIIRGVLYTRYCTSSTGRIIRCKTDDAIILHTCYYDSDRCCVHVDGITAVLGLRFWISHPVRFLHDIRCDRFFHVSVSRVVLIRQKHARLLK